MNKSLKTQLTAVAGILVPCIAFAGPENYSPGAFDAFIYVFVGLVLIEISGVVGLILRWLNSRSRKPRNLIDYIVIPFSTLLSAYNGFLLWIFLNAHDSSPASNSPEMFFVAILFIISALAAFTPRSWLAKVGPKKR